MWDLAWVRGELRGWLSQGKASFSLDQFPSDLLSPLEAQNAAFILQYQNQHNLRWIP